MIVFRTYCWTEIDSQEQWCPACGRDLQSDTRSYDDKMVAALHHPLAAARIRICWLIGENHVQTAIDELMQMAEHDSDLFVRCAAVDALGHLQDARAEQLLIKLSKMQDRFIAPAAQHALHLLDRLPH